MQIRQRHISVKKKFILMIIYATLYMKLTADLVLTLRGSFLPFRTGNIFLLISASTLGVNTTFLHLKKCRQIDMAMVKLT